MSKSIRIRTTPNGDDKFIKINMEQDFDFVEILSLKISQKELYTRFCADYGAIVGRVIVNNGFGVPNAKVSVFIPVDDVDNLDPETRNLYPFETIADTDTDGIRYNLLPSSNETNDECFTPVGTFPDKRQFLDNDNMLDVYCEYYKYTTTTNEAGDYMIFGVPTGAHIMYVEADLSDIGQISQKPYDYIRRGSSAENFDSVTKFRREDNMDSMNNIVNRSPVGVNVQPFWGDEDNCNVMITRRDIDLQVNVQPHAMFMGSIYGDNEENSLNLDCRPRKGMGVLNGQTAGSGKIEMIRETVEGGVERYDVKGGQVIDDDGTWAYQIPMNIDYRITDEYGDLVPSDDPKKGLPTKANVRFRIGMDVTGGEGRLRSRAKHLVPHNPRQLALGASSPEFPDGVPGVDFEFGPSTHKSSFHTMEWNTIYSVKQFVPRYSKTDSPSDNTVRSFLGIKDVDSARGKYTPHPFNRLNVESSSLFEFICGLVLALAGILIMINLFIIAPINGIIRVINDIIEVFGGDGIAYVSCVTLKCQGRDYAPGCLSCDSEAIPSSSFCPGCEAAGGGNQGNTACVGSDPGNDWDETDPLGDAGYTNCVALSLLESENLLKFDFYNDWVNGGLYSPLFKYRTEEADGGEERFCEWSCGGGGVSNNPNTPYDNDCYGSMYLVDTCIENCQGDGITKTGSRFINEGFIEKNDDTLYYATYARNTNRRFLATDIITLGSSVKCHWKNLPYVFDLFPSTTYNMPPLTDEVFQDPNNSNAEEIFVSGIDNSSRFVWDSLFVNVNCINYQDSSFSQCGNLRRQCELGVGLNQYRDINGNITIAQDPDASPVIRPLLTNDDMDYRFGRNVFAWMNSYQVNQLNASPTDVDCQWAGNPDCGNQHGTQDYNFFRYNTDDFGTIKQAAGYETENSFYFYFGLERSATALQKMKEKYFAPCPVTDPPAFVVVGDVTNNTNINVPNGEIDVTIIGGTAPYTFTWIYPDGTVYVVPPTIQNQINGPDIDGLAGGTYVLTVVDSGGLSVTTTFIVQDPITLGCIASSIDASYGEDDGSINVFASGGYGDYTFDIVETVSQAPVGTSVPATPYTDSSPSQLFLNYPAGTYDVTVTDQSGATCNSQVVVNEPDELTIIVNNVWSENSIILPYGSPLCPSVANGFLNIVPTGGTGPYSVSVYCPDMELPDGSFVEYSANTFNNSGLGEGDFEVTVTDSDGQTVQITYILNYGAAPVLSDLPPVTTVTPEVVGGDGTITIDLAPLQPNSITYYLNGTPQLGGSIPQTFDNLAAGLYDIYFIADGCSSNVITVEVLPP